MLLSYKGFVAQLEYDPGSDCILGEVVNAPDVLTFAGTDLVSLKKNFYSTIEDYLSFISEMEVIPARPSVSRYTLYLSADEQRKLFAVVGKENLSVNRWLNRELQLILKKCD